MTQIRTPRRKPTARPRVGASTLRNGEKVAEILMCVCSYVKLFLKRQCWEESAFVSPIMCQGLGQDPAGDRPI